jgi:hypothetical protein
MTRNIFVTMIVICVTTSLAGCAVNTPGLFQSTYCAVEKPISWSQHDTDKSIAGIKEHNAVYDSICGPTGRN